MHELLISHQVCSHVPECNAAPFALRQVVAFIWCRLCLPKDPTSRVHRVFCSAVDAAWLAAFGRFCCYVVLSVPLYSTY